MNKMLLKEIKLTASPLSFIFVAFSLMTLIPGYPILLGAFFVCFGIFQSFQKAREENDILYCAMLPINKRDIVTSKYLFVLLIQATAFLCMITLTLLRLFVLNKVTPYSTNQMMNANLVFLGFVLVVFGVFNLVFVGGFFKTAYKIGIPFFAFAFSAFLLVIISEVLWRIPVINVLNYGYHFSHLIVFAISLVLYGVLSAISLIKSQKRFEKIDL